MSSILALGEVLWDIMPSSVNLGGAPMNAALHLAALGETACVLSRVGDDERGREAVEQIKRAGADTEFIQIDTERPTGTATVTLDADGAPTYDIPFNAGYNYISVDDEIIGRLNEREFDLICFGTMAQKGEVSRAALHAVLDRVKTPHVFCDVNLRLGFYPEDVLDYSFSKATLVKINIGEAEIVSEVLFGEKLAIEVFAGRMVRRYGFKCLLITLGEHGCEAFTERTRKHFPGVKVKVDNTVGAGDAFSAGFIHKFLQSDMINDAVVFANAMGAFVSTKTGAVPPLDLEVINKWAGLN